LIELFPEVERELYASSVAMSIKRKPKHFGRFRVNSPARQSAGEIKRKKTSQRFASIHGSCE
jgi:hypothetical protein